MIVEAIEALSEENGSSKSSISTYGDLPAVHSQLLSDNLKRMKDGGELMFWKNNYSKVKPNATPRRGRGRPAKTKDHLQVRSVDPAMHRGRPTKDSNAPPIPANVVMSSSARTNCMENADENHVHMEKDKPKSNLCEKNMEEKIDCIVQTLECLQNSVETLNTKIESLTKENDELSKELEAALATVEALEQLDWCVLVDFCVAII
ncbi:hypothetical protein FNV43_RR19063 [Rhamnella rubrinervis]|uniref:H15 domain-containing protein n=1 Tax=Rhamnella rubrinervis TaxID=2594499 RepID=A0A8K0E050_9ROSA|nr:hypothetical protein FNV43_RR19063 [Rhamnella rubrinervis]